MSCTLFPTPHFINIWWTETLWWWWQNLRRLLHTKKNMPAYKPYIKLTTTNPQITRWNIGSLTPDTSDGKADRRCVGYTATRDIQGSDRVHATHRQEHIPQLRTKRAITITAICNFPAWSGATILCSCHHRKSVMALLIFNFSEQMLGINWHKKSYNVFNMTTLLFKDLRMMLLAFAVKCVLNQSWGQTAAPHSRTYARGQCPMHIWGPLYANS